MSFPKNIQLLNFPDEFGAPQKFYLMTMEGCTCSEIASFRKAKFYCDAGIANHQMLLMAARQLQDEQGKKAWKYHAQKQADSLQAMKTRLSAEDVKSIIS